MTHKRDLLSPASVLARVRNQARPGQSVKHAQILFVLERFLARLALSRYREAFVLKGGILLFLTESTHWARPTEDIDLLARNLPAEALEDILAEVAGVDAGDRILFDGAGMRWEEIREEDLHPCRRFLIPYRFGDSHRGQLRLDVSFGDPVHPLPRRVDITPRFEGHLGGRVLAYPIETVLAEKTHAILTWGVHGGHDKEGTALLVDQILVR